MKFDEQMDEQTRETLKSRWDNESLLKKFALYKGIIESDRRRNNGEYSSKAIEFIYRSVTYVLDVTEFDCESM